MAAQVTVTYDKAALDHAKRILVAKIKAVGDFSEPFEDIAKDFYAIEANWFDTEGGGRWKPLSRGYAAWKHQMYPGAKILQRSGKMYRAFTGKQKSMTVTKSSLVIRADGVDYWKKHQSGDPSTHLPKRPVLSPVIATRIKTWKSLITDYLYKKVL